MALNVWSLWPDSSFYNKEPVVGPYLIYTNLCCSQFFVALNNVGSVFLDINFCVLFLIKCLEVKLTNW